MVKIWITGRIIGDDVELIVRDNGIGIPKHLHQRIFAPFFTTDESEGMGLGLALCQSIIHTVKGRMELSSEVGLGTSFTMRIPIYDMGHAEQRTSDAHVGSPTRIVVIDNHLQVLDMMADFLSDYDVSVFRDIDAAIPTIDQNTSLILCDARLPSGGTDKLIRHLVEIGFDAQPRVGFITNIGQPTQSIVTANLHCSDLEKPFTQDQMTAFVERMLKM